MAIQLTVLKKNALLWKLEAASTTPIGINAETKCILSGKRLE